jgi:hypothetical protein
MGVVSLLPLLLPLLLERPGDAAEEVLLPTDPFLSCCWWW